MKTRVAVLAIIVEDAASVPQLNDLLHENSEHIIGRMGIPYRAKKINVMSVAVDPPGRDRRPDRQDRCPARHPRQDRLLPV